MDVADLRLDRIAGADVERLRISARTRPALDAVHRARAEHAASGERLADWAQATVPLLDRPQRRILLRRRRDLHNGRDPDGLASDLAACGAPAGLLAGWERTRAGLAHTRECLEAAVRADGDDADEALLEALRQPELLAALTLLSPSFAADVVRGRALSTPRGRRTGWRYLMRAALKPSPMSSLTTVRFTGSTAPGRRVTRVPAELVQHLLAAVAGDPRWVGAFELRPPWVVPGRVDGRVVLSTPYVATGPGWIHEALGDISLHGAELEPGGPPVRLARLVATGLLRPVPPWSAGCPDPLAKLATAIEAEGGPGAALRRVEESAAHLAELEPRRRPEGMQRLRRAVDAATTALDAAAWTGALVHEDVRSPGPAARLPAAVGQELRAAAEPLRRQLFRSHAYDVLLDRFRADHGAGGRAPAAAWLTGLLDDDGFMAAYRAAGSADRQFDPGPDGAGRDRLPVGRTSAPPSLALQYQLGASSPEELGTGRFHLVVNRHGSALGGLVTRYLAIGGDDEAVAGLWRWLNDCFPGSEVRTVAVAAQVNSLSHAGAGRLPELVWPTDLLPRRLPARGFETVRLVHDPRGGVLEFETDDGRPVAPVYTGIVPAGRLRGAIRLASVLMNPWVDGSRRAGPEPAVTPRRQSGRRVLERAHWTLDAAELPRPAAEPVTAYLLRVDQWRRRLDLPREVFLSRPGTGDHKPIWLDLASPASLAAALPPPDAGPVVLEEALPGREEAWFAGGTGTRVVEHLGFVRWDRPC